MAFHHSLLILSAAVFLLIGSTAADIPDDCGIAVYWGQNALEGSLKDACDSGNYKDVAIGFLVIFGSNPDKAVLNLGGHCDPSNGGCAYLAEEIEYCKKKDIKVLLSISGGVSNEETGDAKPMINYLTNTFLKPSESNGGPFGNASVDGFDFRISEGSEFYYYNLAWGLGQDHKAYLTASPGCHIPSEALDVSMRAGLFKKIWVQFFNEPSCDFSSGIDNLVASWNRWMAVTSPVSRLFLSLPASPAAAQTGYIEPELLAYEVLPRIRYSNRYGGVALWNRYYDESNNYSPQIIRPVCDYRYSLKKKSFISQVVA